jgi:hypothetical protein
LLGSESELENYLAGKNKLVESIQQVVTEPIEIASPINTTVIDTNEESLLIDKYSAIIKTRQDLLTLSAEDRAEIKKVFNSEFRFFSCLQNKK